MLGVAGCAPAPVELHGPTMGTTYSVVVPAPPAGLGRERLQALVDGVLAEVNSTFSTYDPGTELSRFNDFESTAPVAASPMLRELVGIAEGISVRTGGAFDVTVGPLVGLWGFGSGAVTSPETGRGPDRMALASARALVGYRKLVVDPGTGTLRKSVPGLVVDVDGIAPGYAVDLIAERLEALGVHRYLVELGGELRGRGLSPEGRPWRVAIESPRAGERRPYALVELNGLGISTSGDYRDSHVLDGRRVSHTIDPRTGAPVPHDLASVTVADPSAARADGYATAFMVLGPKEGYELATELGIAALFIERSSDGKSFKERATPQFERLRRPLG